MDKRFDFHASLQVEGFGEIDSCLTIVRDTIAKFENGELEKTGQNVINAINKIDWNRINVTLVVYDAKQKAEKTYIKYHSKLTVEEIIGEWMDKLDKV